jgi:RNA polymerase sigma factor (sigma-70 family)
MTEHDQLADHFEAHRAHLRGVAYRMLGSASEAEDVVQEAWLRFSRSGDAGIDNLGGWLTTVVSRLSLDVLRSRKSRREESIEVAPPRSVHRDPEQEALLADSVGLALLVVLDQLTPGERLAFVLHDMFAMSFDEIAAIVGRSAAATRQLASRARRRVQGSAKVPGADLARHRRVADAFLTALRKGDFEGLLAALDPDVVVRADSAAEIRGAEVWAKTAVVYSQGARFVQVALVDGAVGLVLAPRGKLVRALTLTFTGEKIAGIHVITDPAHLERLELGILS